MVARSEVEVARTAAEFSKLVGNAMVVATSFVCIERAPCLVGGHLKQALAAPSSAAITKFWNTQLLCGGREWLSMGATALLSV